MSAAEHTSDAVSRTKQVSRLGKLLLPAEATTTALLYLTGEVLKENKLFHEQAQELHDMRKGMKDLEDENRTLRLCLFLNECGIPSLLKLLGSMNIVDRFYLVRLCYCIDCIKLTPFAHAGSRQKLGCLVFPHFQAMCAKRGLKLAVLPPSSRSEQEPPVTFVLQNCLCYMEDAHLVMEGPNDWKTLGYGTRVTEAQTFHGNEIDQIRHLFNDVQKCRAMPPQKKSYGC